MKSFDGATMTGMFFLVVGASGVGKDSILDGARSRLQNSDQFIFAKRTLTRDKELGGEDYDSVSEDVFSSMVAERQFIIDWRAHGYRYGIPAQLLDELRAGKHVFANVSRSALGEIADIWDNVVIIEITARPETIAARLRSRGREDEHEINLRLQRQSAVYPDRLDVISVANDTTLDVAIDRFVDAAFCAVPAALKVKQVRINTWRENICYLHEACKAYEAETYLGPNKLEIFNATHSVRAKLNTVADDQLVGVDEIGLSTAAFEKLGLPEGSAVMIDRTPSPESTASLRSKIAGETLSAGQLDMIVRDIAEDRYSRREISAFLVAASKNLNLDELEALTKARAYHSQQLDWPVDLVADKHSMGGVPGSRITLIVIPIVAAYGMTIPKTSSRAITSASGTADAMEVLARVDLSQADVKQVVEKTGGCIAWNGNLNHSPVDDVMNAITRPLAIDSQRWSVASILSKKLAAGSTHVIVDIPYGRGSKTPSLEDAEVLAALFEAVGARIGLTIEAKATNGSKPIGRGIGPALEVRDVYAVLKGHAHAPAELRDKALDFAGRIIEWDDKIDRGKGRPVAARILDSGQALATFEKMIDAQGRKDVPDTASSLLTEVHAQASGTIIGLRGNVLSGIARSAGAPFDKGAGVDIIAGIGQSVVAGEPIMLIHGSTTTEMSTALDYAARFDAFEIQ
ncbi:MAG: phosphonate metabolism protein/1,5-bisphosphokinase (PRPP-forming) PhnN [Hyphomicrobiaceae bacterium]